jgi:hypothetical protein
MLPRIVVAADLGGLIFLLLAWHDAHYLIVRRYRVFFIVEVALLCFCIVTAMVDMMGFGIR